MNLPEMIIRKAVQKDIQAVTAIYNDAVVNTTTAFDTEPKTIAEQEK